MLAGFLLKDQDIPWWFWPFKMTSFCRYFFLALVKNEFTNLNDCKPVYLCYVPEEYNAVASMWSYMLALMVMGAVVRAVAFVIWKLEMRKYER